MYVLRAFDKLSATDRLTPLYLSTHFLPTFLAKRPQTENLHKEKQAHIFEPLLAIGRVYGV